jgi:hypothetical protein
MPSATNTKVPRQATLPIAHMVCHLYRHPCGTVGFGLQAAIAAEAGHPAEFAGVAEPSTPGELRALADRIEGLLA